LGESPRLGPALLGAFRDPPFRPGNSKPTMTPGRAAILKVISIYREMRHPLSQIEVQKLVYFLARAGQHAQIQETHLRAVCACSTPRLDEDERSIFVRLSKQWKRGRRGVRRPSALRSAPVLRSNGCNAGVITGCVRRNRAAVPPGVCGPIRTPAAR
jgi:hypothetical protein